MWGKEAQMEEGAVGAAWGAQGRWTTQAQWRFRCCRHGVEWEGARASAATAHAVLRHVLRLGADPPLLVPSPALDVLISAWNERITAGSRTKSSGPNVPAVLAIWLGEGKTARRGRKGEVG